MSSPMFPNWTRRLFPGSSEPKLPSLPFLPETRARPITPPEGSTPSDAAVCKSALFTRVPFEVRRQILIEAFGEQTIHIDLVYDRPHEEKNGKYHRFRRAPRYDGKPENRPRPSKLHLVKSKRYLWYSCVCHQGFPNASQWSRTYEPCDDDCGDRLVGCHFWPGELPGKCSLGVMGWLLTCRQAYSEGMNVLWATNTIRIEQGSILRHAQRLFLPHRWAQVPRVEAIETFGYRDHVSYTDSTWRVTTVAYLDGLIPALETLRELHISVQTHAIRPPGTGDDPKGGAMATLLLIEGMLRKLPPTVKECTVAVPSSVYKILRDDAAREGRAVERYSDRQRERHWRLLLGAPTQREGYWVQLGKVDMATNLLIPCFGTGSIEFLDGTDIAREDLILYGLKWA